MGNLAMRDFITDAIRYWEPRRILYNAVLLVVVVATCFLQSAGYRQARSFELLQHLFVLAVLANVAYCAAYPVDLLVQFSGFRDTWLRARWVLLLIGILFAAVISHLFAQGIFGNAA